MRPDKLILAAAMLSLALPLAAAKKKAKPSPKPTPVQEARPMQGVHQFTVKTIDGAEKSLGDYHGKVLLFVNVASHCGNTPQYKGLQALYEKYKDKGFAVLGFPANDFGRQEPGSEAEIKEFCSSKYAVTFDMFSKISVKGEAKAPVYKYLTEQSAHTGEIGWNFGKYLVGKDGLVLGYFGPGTKPESGDISKAIESALAAK